MKNLRFRLLSLATLTLSSASAAELLWDGGTTNIATNGDGLSTYTGGTWSTTITNQDQGSALPHLAWNNGDSAVFAGTYAATGTKTVAIGSNVTVNQIKVNTGSTSGNRYDIGASATQNDFAITFGGSYGDATPAIDGSTTGFLNTNFNAKITGPVTGGLVVKHGSNITTPGTSGRFALTNANCDFTGDLVMVAGNLSVGTQLGAPANKLVLKGGALFISGGAGTSTFSRNIDVAAASGIATNSIAAGQVMDLTGTLTGSGNLTRYVSAGGASTSEVRFSGNLAGYTGTYENAGPAGSLATIQSTATSGGAWKLSGGTVKLNTASDDAAIAHGPGKSDLLMNGGTLNLNGKSETINGLSGATGTVTNGLAATTSTLTLGAGDATAGFGGTIQNGIGTLALTKIGSGTQTLAGNGNHTGTTTVEGGKLVLGGLVENSPVIVKSGAALTISNAFRTLQALTLEGGSTLTVPLDTASGYLAVDDALTFTGGTVTIVPTFSDAPALGSYELVLPTGGITGSATILADFSSNGATRVSGTVQAVDGVVSVNVNSLGASLSWNNAAANGTWNLNTSANFLNGASNDVFKQYDHVVFGPASPTGSVTLDGTLLPASVTVNSANNFTFSGTGSIGGSAALNKSGNGTLTVANTNTFSGETTVTGGTLAVNGTLGSSDVVVEAAATLKGSGTIAGDVMVDGTLAPGASVGTLATGDMTLTGTYVCELDGATADKLVVTGNLDISGATLTLNVAAAPTALNYVIATCTGGVTGTFASVPAGYVVDTSNPGQIVLWPESSIPVFPAGTLTFETTQSYPTAPTELAGVNAAAATFTGINGWSLSTSSNGASVLATGSSGSYFGGQAIGTNSSGTYVGGIKDVIQVTGTNTITFDAPFFSGTSVGFMKDVDNDGLFEATDPGMAFGVGGTPARFQYRNAAFGTENFGTGFVGTAGHWYRFNVTIGNSVGGSRSITMAVHNLTTNTGFDFNTATPEIDPWAFSVTDAQFGPAPELAHGIFVRTTATARIDNVRVTSVVPPVGTAYDTWMDGFPTLIGNDRLGDADPDRDGTKNLLEFVLNGNPTVSDQTILPLGSKSGGNLVFTFHRRDDSEGLVNQSVQYGTNLSIWTTLAIGAASGANYTVDELGAAPDLITVTIPAGADPKKFIRLLVTETP